MLWLRLRWLILPLMWLAMPSAAPAEQGPNDQYCGMYPPEISDTGYGGFSSCQLKDLGEKPLWKGLNPKYRQQIRLTYTNGQQPGFRVIDFVERPDGTGRIRMRESWWAPGDEPEVTIDTSFWVSAADVAKINALGAESTAWQLPMSTWDRNEIYMHCDTLDMERIDAAGYRYSFINISCNQPKRLMPFLAHMAKLARLKPGSEGVLVKAR